MRFSKTQTKSDETLTLIAYPHIEEVSKHGVHIEGERERLARGREIEKERREIEEEE